LSDPSQNKKQGVDWRPLIPDHYKNGKKLEEVFSPLSGGDDAADFKPLYSGEGKPDEDGEFRLIYSPLEEAESRFAPGGGDPEAAPEHTSVVPTIEQEAYDKGFAKGEKDGFEAGKKQADLIVVQIQAILSEVQTLREKMVKSYEAEILDLVCRAVEKVVYGQVELDDEMVKRAILDAFEMIPELDDITINLNPEDYENIDTLREDVFEQVKDLRNVSIIANSAVGRGGCKVESRSGDIDATIDQRLDAITKSIIKAGGRVTDEE
jgi:flagellar assembly protein FliH